MAGTKGRSGRKDLQRPAVPAGLPEIGDTKETVSAFVDAVARKLAAGDLDVRVAEALTRLAAVNARLVVLNYNRGEILDEVRKLHANYEELERQGRAKAEAVRNHTIEQDGPAVWHEDEHGRWYRTASDGRRIYEVGQ